MHMGGCETLWEVSQEQMDGLTGGRVLRAEGMAAVSGSTPGVARPGPNSHAAKGALTPLCVLVCVASPRLIPLTYIDQHGSRHVI